MVLQFPNFHKLSIVSLLAAIMSLGYSTIATGIAGHQGKQPGVVYNVDGFTLAQGVFGCEPQFCTTDWSGLLSFR